ncbi:glyoxylase-like metal-dependent hydrolase (beta-lactamase superfamily II) [Paenibacillus phyllosphaerae]|uniref:Glyoxylase-like metal-dependent hydrolase (Beta-lactamase superfamily II) n=1 Tax=Paenibacillus phyllosphaerae TaxID=274593 RepID=A0A7W5B3E8_9BACL|nr:MBL fold metallo-hydrolase [Paenibacillus phyllosphaerae]MBB3113718.1 glyoxylase-like metal-dependent hydrolase (beta-lactamase superfamily II) [Paenibacillus phyllosphaerae]
MIHELTKRFAYMSADGSVDRPILGAVLGEDRILFVDAGNSLRHASAFREAVREAYGTRPSLTALTHWHWDHSFGAAYDASSPLVATEMTRQALQQLVGLDWSDEALDERVREGKEIAFCADYIKKEYEGMERDIRISLPDMTFTDALTLHLGAVSCEMQHIGGIHAEDSCIMYVPEERVLFLGDVLGPAIYDGPRYYVAQDFLRIVEKIKTYPAAWYIESHHRPVTAEEFWPEINEYCTLAELVMEYGPNKQRIERELARQMKRELADGDRDAIHQFLLGDQRQSLLLGE